MAKKNRKSQGENRVSLLAMPDYMSQQRRELYFWYQGDPFSLERRKARIVSSSGEIAITGAQIDDTTLEIFNEMASAVDVVGSLIAKRDVMVANVPASSAISAAEKLTRFFGLTGTWFSEVPDKKLKIALTPDPEKRIDLVRSVHQRFSSSNLPSVKLVRPEPHPEIPAPKSPEPRLARLDPATNEWVEITVEDLLDIR